MSRPPRNLVETIRRNPRERARASAREKNGKNAKKPVILLCITGFFRPDFCESPSARASALPATRGSGHGRCGKSDASD